jgi:hypothetical protein
VYIQACTRFAIDEDRRFDRVEGVIRPSGVSSTRRPAIKPGCVDRLHVACFVKIGREAEQHAQNRHFKLLHPRTDGGEIGDFSHR